MRIAILGSRGIPNHYGGFEQFAEFLSQGLVKLGHVVYVYNSHNHPYKNANFKKVHIIHKYDPEFIIGSAGQCVYDLFCILDARKKNFDFILKLGYGTNYMWNWLFPKNSIIITNLDGLEWKRAKYNKFTKLFLKLGEVFTVKNCDHIITDSLFIHKYLKKIYQVPSYHVPYGAAVINNTDHLHIKKFQIEPFSYDLLVARLVPENNIEMILRGVVKSGKKRPFLIVGNYDTRYGKFLKKKFNFPFIRFIGVVFNKNELDNLRYYSNLYFHGHSAGGTNPSLLEAMACHGLICSHDNEFNKSVLGEDAYYFSNEDDVAKCLILNKMNVFEQKKIAANIEKIKTQYCWDDIVIKYHELFNAISLGERNHNKFNKEPTLAKIYAD